jgi:N-acetylneuraminic acid mutarotase
MVKSLLYLAVILILDSSCAIELHAQARDLHTQRVVLDDGNGHTTTLQAPAGPPNNVVTLPSGTGTSGQVIQTDGSGNLSWVMPAGSLPSGAVVAFQSNSPVSGFTYTGTSQILGGWATEASNPIATHGSASGVINGKIYVITGSTSPTSGEINNNEEYDPALNTWTARAPIPTPRRYVSCAVVGGKLYVIGGASGPGNGVDLSTNEEYTPPPSDSWAARAPMPTPRQNLTAAAVSGKIYAIGGTTAASFFYNVNEEYTPPPTDSWATRAPMLTARNETASGVVNNQIYVVGGFNGTYQGVNEQYTPPPTDSWSGVSSLPGARLRASAVASTLNNKLYIFTGANPTLSLTTEVIEYTPLSDSYLLMPSIPSARQNSVAGTVGANIYVIGGYNGSARVTTNDQFTPPLSLFYFSKN